MAQTEKRRAPPDRVLLPLAGATCGTRWARASNPAGALVITAPLPTPQATSKGGIGKGELVTRLGALLVAAQTLGPKPEEHRWSSLRLVAKGAAAYLHASVGEGVEGLLQETRGGLMRV